MGLFLEAMRPYAVSVVENNKREDLSWDEDFEQRIEYGHARMQWQQKRMQINNTGSDLKGLIDFGTLITFVIVYKDELHRELRGKSRDYNKLRSCLQELKDTRNQWAHYDEALNVDEAERAFSNMRQVAKILEMPELDEELKRLMNPDSGQEVSRAAGVRGADTSSMNDDTARTEYNGSLEAWFNCIRPQFDIRNNRLDESVFAANIEDVAAGTAPTVYQDIVQFFDRTYVTDGMRDLARRVVQTLNGTESQNRVISLQTGFGGGKTHSLISVYHIVNEAPVFRNLSVAAQVLEPRDMPQFNDAKVAVFTNNTVSVTDGHRIPEEGLTTHTLWGELAFQLGGIEAYERLRNADEQMIAPTAGDIKPIIEAAQPALILIDELADYCNKAAGKRVGGSTLFAQTNSFMQTLTEVVATVPKAVMICILPASAAEVASSAIGQEILSALENRVVRVGTSVKPVHDEEIYEVVRRRLFDPIENADVPKMVAARYRKMYDNRRADLPDEASRMAYAEKIRKAYPFHPELIDMFRLRWGSDSKFQRTRGVLRLLASIVGDLWKRRNSLTGTQTLIHTSDVLTENLPTLRSQITSLMGPQWDTVMTADIVGASSNAAKLEEQNITTNIGKFRLPTAVMTTVLMASVGGQQRKGLTKKELKLCLLKPEAFQHLDIDTTLYNLENISHYMYRSTVASEQSYWFQSKPNINILINQAKGDITPAATQAEIVAMLRRSASNCPPLRILIDPSEEVPEQRSLTLAILSPIHTVQTGGAIGSITRSFIRTIAEQRGNTQRVYRNTILFLLANETALSALSTQLIEYLACVKILNEYSGQIDADQRSDVNERKQQTGQKATEQLLRRFNTVAKCVRGEIKTLQIDNMQADFQRYITENVIGALQEESWVLRNRMSMKVVEKAGMVPAVEHPVNVKDFYEAFLRFDDKPMLYTPEVITATVKRYLEEGAWNVGTGEPGHFTRIYTQTDSGIHFLDPTRDEDYWLLEPSVQPVPASGTGASTGSSTGASGAASSTGSTPSDGSSSGTSFPGGASETGAGTEPSGGSSPAKVYNKVTISGDIPMENYSQLFSSFVQTLRQNNLRISMKFSAMSTPSTPSPNPLLPSAASRSPQRSWDWILSLKNKR